MPQILTKLGPADSGRRMTLHEFEQVECMEGYLCELGRGIITVSDVPNLRHLAQVTAMRRQLAAYDLANPGRIHTIAAGSECKLLITGLDSARHPDLAVYRTAPDDIDNLWTTWIPDIVIEVVSPGSEQRDYVEKREEYLEFAVREYWIVDADKVEVMVLRRMGGRWRERIVRLPEPYQTRLLPGFSLDCAAVFQAAQTASG
jgi:hypothetical protein